MSRFSTVTTLVGETYGDARAVTLAVALCTDSGEVRLDIEDHEGSLRDVVLQPHEVIALQKALSWSRAERAVALAPARESP